MSQEPQSKMLIQLVTMKMPYGKYKGWLLCDLPAPYLSWNNANGYPKGQMGQLVESIYDIKH